jgi:hypothetical protein
MNQAAPKAGGSSRRAVTGDEFFHRFPALHPFLLAELADATVRDGLKTLMPGLFNVLFGVRTPK